MALLLPGIASGQYALYFGAPGGDVRVEASEATPAFPKFTVECRIKTGAVVRQRVRLVSRWQEDPDADARGAFHLTLTSTNRVAFGVCNQDGKSGFVTGQGTWKDGKWHHLAGSWDGTKLAVYLDGKNIGAKELPGFGSIGASSLPLVFGPTSAGRKRPPVFEGFLGDVRLYARDRSAVEIRGELEGAAEEPVGLLAHYPLLASSPVAEVPDLSGSGPSGQLASTLARMGWCCAATWNQRDRVGVDLACIDLHAVPAEQGAARPRAGDRKILVGHDKRSRPGVLWQDARSREIYITWVDPVDGVIESHLLEGVVGGGAGILASGTTDPDGKVYYLVYQETPSGRGEDVALLATMFKADPAGEPILSNGMDNTRRKFNVWSFGRRGHGNMRYSKGVLGMILPRTMYRSSDGLRHQAAIAVSISAKTLQVIRNLGTTSSHSKGNILGVDSKGDFLGVDLGDNYPRGVHLHKFSATNKGSAVVFTFKTAHGTKPRNGSPAYPEISRQGRQFYKWSNDNNTYSELGAVLENRKQFTVLFSTDQSLDGKVLDNGRAFRNCSDPRNLAMLRVVKRFQKGGRGSVVSDSLMVRLPKGNEVEEGGFFNFGGRWSKQRVTGVTWLTQYQEDEGAHNPQAIETSDGGAVVLWEKTSPRGDGLQVLRLDKRGKPSAAIDLGVSLRLNRQDRLLRLGDRIYLIGSEGRGGEARLYFIRDDS